MLTTTTQVVPGAGVAQVDPGPPAAGDRRDVLAAERTFLAWIRTCLALLAAGTALVTFRALPHPTARAVAGMSCMLCAGVLAVGVCRAWTRIRRAAPGIAPVAGPRAAQALTGAVLVAAVALAAPSACRAFSEPAAGPGLHHLRPGVGPQSP